MSDPPPEVSLNFIDVAAPAHTPPAMPTVQVENEPTIHGLVGTYFGDLEVDQGKSVRWLEYFADDLFITDINSGEQRYWVVDWAATFPASEHTVTGRNFFFDAANWRREQFEYGDKAFHYDDDDWCLFIDGSDGLSFDARTLPNDYNALPFMSWVYREIEQAVTAGRDHATFPLFIYLHDSDLQTITYGANVTPDAVELGIPATKKPLAVPWYLPYQGLTRLWKVSALRNPSFDWTLLDRPVPYEVKAGTGVAASPAYLNPEVGQASTPHQASFNLVNGVAYRLSVRAEVASMTWYYSTFVDKAVGNNVDYKFLLVQGNNNIFFEIAEPTGTTYQDILITAPIPYGPPHTYAADFVPNTTTAATWVDGVKTNRTAPQVMRAANSTAPVVVGNSITQGRIYWAQLERLDAVGGNPVATLWKFDPNERTGTGTTYTDPRGHVWTLTNVNAIVPAVAAVPAEPAAKAQIISYAYAHWQPLDIPPGQTEVPPLSVANDHGYRMRKLISNLRPIPGIPFGEPWTDPSADPVGAAGPWGVDVVSKVDPAVATTVEEDGHTPPESITAGILTPIYTSVVRLNLREDLWYEQGTYGNIPLFWDDVNQKWTPVYSPDQWPIYGLGSKPEPSPPLSPKSLRLGGAPGDHVLSQPPATEGLAFDLQFSLSLVVCAALDQWFDGEQSLVSQDQAWSWTVDTDGGMTFSRSRDGTTFYDFTIPPEEVPAWADEETVTLGVSYVTATDPDITVEPKDEVRFWIWDGEVWEQLGDTQSTPNNDDLPIFDSTAPIKIGGGTPGLFRLVSIRQNVSDDSGVGSGEMARMRGDITSNPSHDRYGNTWTNYGTWSSEDMQDIPTLP